MGLIKSLKRLKLKKLQPGKLLKGAVNAAAAIGIPGAGAAAGIANRVGQRVDQANRVIEKAKAEVQKLAKDQGISTAEASAQLAERSLNAADAGLTAQKAAPLLLLGGAVVLMFLLMRRK